MRVRCRLCLGAWIGIAYYFVLASIDDMRFLLSGLLVAAAFTAYSCVDQEPPVASDQQKGTRSWNIWGRRAKELTMDNEAVTSLDNSLFARVKLFIMIQLFFLVLSAFTGGFNFRIWSMMDSSLFLMSIGVVAIVPVLEERWMQLWAFRASIFLYLAGLVAMVVAVLVSGVVGIRGITRAWGIE